MRRNQCAHGIVKRISCFILILFLIMGPNLSYVRGETNVYDSLEWNYDIDENEFIIYNAWEVFEDQPDLRCIVGIYKENGQMLSCGMVEPDPEGKIEVKCTGVDIPQECSMRVYFIDSNYAPVAPTMTYCVSITEPTCTENGYAILEWDEGKRSKVIKVFAAQGHSINEIVSQKPVDAVTCGTALRECEVCAFSEEVAIYPECDIARLCMYGDLTGIGKKAEVPVSVSFEGAGQELDCYALLKYQGHTSLVYDKKNFTIKLFKDEALSQKNKIVFYDWNKEHKYILKANYIDNSGCRNLVCADIWSEMVACRDNYPSRLADSSNFGATDGFPMALYLNDEYIGLYSLTLHRDDDLFDMEDGNRDGILVVNTAQSESAFFRAPATFDDQSDWEVEYSGLEDDTQWLEDKLNTLIEFVNTASDEAFKENLSQYLDVNSAIDYLIAIYSLGLTNSGAKNITVATYDDGPLFFSLCDMENAFGLSATGEQVFAPYEYLPTYNDGVWDSATGSLLWNRMLQNYEKEICDRYTELRKDVLTSERICGKVSDFLYPISEDFYKADSLLYPEMPHIVGSVQSQIEEYVSQRLILLDQLFLNQNVE